MRKKGGEIALPGGNVEYTLFNERGYLVSAIGNKFFVTDPNHVTNTLVLPSFSFFGDMKAVPSEMEVSWSPNLKEERFAFRVLDGVALNAVNTDPTRDAMAGISSPYYFGIAQRNRQTKKWSVRFISQYSEFQGTGADIELVGGSTTITC